MKLVTLNELLTNWYRFSEPITREEIDLLDWDELLMNLGIYCPDAEGKNIMISDVDMKTYTNPAVSFTLKPVVCTTCGEETPVYFWGTACASCVTKAVVKQVDG